ncbi:MAG: Holliday junction branch migration protein RuvA [Campylobacterota bacterium]
MIVALEGKVVLKQPSYIHLNVNGVVYELLVSVNCSSAIENKEIFIHTVQVIREDAHLLFGFVDSDEKKMFETLIKINGVGPKVALAICSTFNPGNFSSVVASSDVDMLKRVPGIGPKSAKRILVELAEFNVGSSDTTSAPQMEARVALESLGFKPELINKVLQSCTSTDTASLVKEALKKIQS